MSFPVGTILQIKRDKAATHKIKVTSANGRTFTATYVDAPGDTSVFTGEIRARENQVLSLLQHHPDKGYAAFHVAIDKTNTSGKKYYAGSWYDVSGHEGLKFELDPLS